MKAEHESILSFRTSSANTHSTNLSGTGKCIPGEKVDMLGIMTFME